MNHTMTEESADAEALAEGASAERAATSPTSVRTAAFLADGRTSAFLLAETVAALVSRQEIQSAIVDISTKAGLATAQRLLDSGVEYRIFDTVPPKWDDATCPLLEQIRTGSQGTMPLDPGDIAAIDANIVLAPAPASDAGPGIDATDGTITAVVMEQLKEARRPCLLVLPPESGLRRQEDGSYVRLTLKIEE